MKLSILVPVYNVEKYIRRCLDSVYTQMDEEDEIILVDDGCTDNSGAICDEYKEKFPSQTFVFHKKNQGAYPTRNYAMDRCSGEYIWLIDPDDYIQEGAIKNIKDFVKKYKYPDVISMSYKEFTEDQYSEIKNSNKNILVSGKEYLNAYIPNPYLWAHVYKRQFLLENKIRFNDNLTTQGDWLFNVYVNIKARKILLSNIYSYNYYIANMTSTLRNPNKKHKIRTIENSLIAVLELKDIVDSNNEYKLLLSNQLAFSTAGMLYATFVNNYDIDFVKYKLDVLKSRNLYPIKKCTNNNKANLFINFVNCRILYLIICKIRNIFMDGINTKNVI